MTVCSNFQVLFMLAAVSLGLGVHASNLGKEIKAKPGGVRPMVEHRGFATTPKQMDALVPYCEKLEAGHLKALDEADGLTDKTRWIAAVCPHDDHVYAGQIYYDALHNLHAKTVILFGVCHQAKKWGLKDKLIFDDFKAWQEPFGDVPVSPLREEIMKALPKGDYVVHDEAQASEWSVEGIVPWIQYANRDVKIVSILVPYMDWQRSDKLAADLGKVLAKIVKEHKLVLGKDLAFVMSTDGTHYGDQWSDGWHYDPFGCTADGYIQAMGQDHTLIRWYLDGDLNLHKLQRLAETLVNQKDVYEYKVTWCGRFSVPLGLASMCHMTADLGRPPLKGVNTGYGTSIGLGFLPFEKMGLEATAHENLHHWVSYIAEGYR
jgi:MEMO1 family protein